MMNALIVYDSEYGNTERIAHAIARGLGTPRLIRARDLAADPNSVSLAECGLLVVGGPTQAHGISPGLRDVLNAIPPSGLRGIRAAAFDTRIHTARFLSGSAAVKISGALQGRGAQLVIAPESFFVHGKGSAVVLGARELERATAWAMTLREKVEPASTPALPL